MTGFRHHPRRNGGRGTAGHTIQLTHCDIDVDITFGVEEYDPGDWENPPSGGSVYDVEFAVSAIHLPSPDGPTRTMRVGLGSIEGFTTAILDLVNHLFDECPGFRDQIHRCCGEAYGSDDREHDA